MKAFRQLALAAVALLLASAIAPASAQIGGGVYPGPVSSTQVIAALGYTPVNKAGDTMTGALAINNALSGSSSTSSLSLTPTWNTTGTPTALKLNLTDTSSNSSSLLLDLQVASASQFKVTKSGGVTANGSINAAGSVNTTDGRMSMLSGPIIDMRGVTTVKLFQTDGVTPVALQTGSVTVPTGTIQYMGSAGGTADALTATPGTALTAYTTGAFYLVKATATNATTTPTLNISALGNKTIVKRASTALAAGDIVNGANLLLVYDGTNMQLLNPVVN